MCLECDFVYPYCIKCAELEGEYTSLKYSYDRKQDILIGECRDCGKKFEVVLRELD